MMAKRVILSHPRKFVMLLKGRSSEFVLLKIEDELTRSLTISGWEAALEIKHSRKDNKSRTLS